MKELLKIVKGHHTAVQLVCADVICVLNHKQNDVSQNWGQWFLSEIINFGMDFLFKIS